MVQKAMLTGAMCAIAPGSPVQLLVAMLVCLAYLVAIVFAGPYKGRMEDQLAFLTSLVLTLSLMPQRGGRQHRRRRDHRAVACRERARRP